MQCKSCSNDMEFISCWDKPEYSDLLEYAFNLYICNECGTICKEDVWDNEGTLWITKKNEVL